MKEKSVAHKVFLVLAQPGEFPLIANDIENSTLYKKVSTLFPIPHFIKPDGPILEVLYLPLSHYLKKKLVYFFSQRKMIHEI